MSEGLVPLPNNLRWREEPHSKKLKSNIATLAEKGSLTNANRGPKTEEKLAFLALEDGTAIHGKGFGAAGTVSGEVVFNTGMVGYTEAITDPSYKGQILMQTYPLVGNYGVNPKHFESDRPQIQGYVVHEACKQPSHWSSRRTIHEFLNAYDVPGIEGIDTRALTQKIRVHGVMKGILSVYTLDDQPDFNRLIEQARHVPDPNEEDLVARVSTTVPRLHNPVGRPRSRIVLIDCGAKNSIIRCLVSRGAQVVQVPASSTVEDIMRSQPEGIVISNGPGDPKKVPYLIETVTKLVDERIPILGICLGNQIISLALGGDTYKLKFGHRGQNHPCIEKGTNRCYITSQNHGFAVRSESTRGTDLEISFINANDNTVEGIRHRELPVEGVQWHPESSPGPHDTEFMFDYFLDLIRRLDVGCNQPLERLESVRR